VTVAELTLLLSRTSEKVACRESITGTSFDPVDGVEKRIDGGIVSVVSGISEDALLPSLQEKKHNAKKRMYTAFAARRVK
jgi:hypothetical protein